MKNILLLMSFLAFHQLSAQADIQGPSEIGIDEEAQYTIKNSPNNGNNSYQWKIDARHFDVLSSIHQPTIKLKASATGFSQVMLGVKKNAKMQWTKFPVHVTDASRASEVYDDHQAKNQRLKSHTKLKTISNPCDIPYLFLLSSDIQKDCIDFSSSVSDDQADYPHQWTIVWANNDQQQFNTKNIEAENNKQNPIKSLKLQITSQHCEKEVVKTFRAN